MAKAKAVGIADKATPLERLERRLQSWRDLKQGPGWLMDNRATTIAKLKAQIELLNKEEE